MSGFDDLFNSDDGGDNSSTTSDIITSLVGAASSAYGSYQLQSAGIIPLPGQPGVYAQTGTQAKIVGPVQNQNTQLILVGIIAVIGLFAFSKVK